MKKKLLLAFMVVAISIIAFSTISVSAATTGTCGTNLTWKLTDSGLLQIQGSGTMDNYSSYIGTPWAAHRDKITKVIISNGVENIGDRAFMHCENLSTIVFPNSVNKIGDCAFMYCWGLYKIVLPNSIKTIGSDVFTYTNLKDGMYYDGTPEEWDNVSIGYYNTYLSDSYIKYTKIAYGSINNNITWVIDGDYKLKITGRGTMPDYSSSSIPWYNYKSNIKEVEINSGITAIGAYSFYDCYKIEKLTLPSTLKTIGYGAFSNCTYLTDLVIPDSVTECNNSFVGCCAKTLYLGKNCTTFPNGMTQLEEINISASNPYFTEIDNVVYTKDFKKMLYYPSSNTDTTYYLPFETEDIGTCLRGKTTLKTVYLSPYVTIGTNTFNYMDSKFAVYAFEDSPAYNTLKSTYYTYYYTSNKTDSRRVTLYSCGVYATCGTNVKGLLCTISIPGWEEKLPINKLIISGNGYMENMSTYPWNSYMNNIKEIVVEDGVKSIGNKAFGYCNNLELIYIGNTVEIIGDEAIYHSSKLKTLNIPDSVKSIGDWAFESCLNLSDITIGKGLESIGRRPFRYNMTIEYKIDENNPNFSSIGGHIYSKDGKKLIRYAIGNTNAEYRIPDGTTTIGFAAFESAVNLKTIHIPLSVTTIESDAFWMVDSSLNKHYLNEVYYEGSKSQWDKINIISGWNYAIEEAIIHYAKSDITIKDTDENILKKMAVNKNYVLSNEDIPQKEQYIYELYTDKDCHEAFVLDSPIGADLVLYIKYVSKSLGKININETLSSTVGDTDINYSLSFATDKDVNALYCFVKYPDTLTLKSVIAKDFSYAGLEDEYTEDGFTTAVILAQYSETELIPKNTIHTPFELTFDVSKSAEPGTVQIEATEESCLIGNDTYFFEERIPGTLEILPKLAESIEISGADVISSETAYTAIVNPDYTTDKSVEWSVDNEGVATISENGVLTPVTSGTVVLTATAKDGSGVTASKTITINRGVTNIEIIGADSITEETTYMANILPDYATDKDVEWSINNTEIATIDQNGLVTPVTSGLVTITAVAKDGSGVSASKDINIIKLAETIEITGEESISSPAHYTAIVSPDYTSDKDVSWSVDNEEIATVDELGVLTPVTSGTVILTATAKDGSGVVGRKTIEIVKFAESIEIVGSEEITEPTQYNVVILPEYTTNKDAEWSVSDETIATVDENGVVTPLKNGKIVLTAKALDASGIETTKSIVITVSVRANSITSDVGTWDKEFDSDITEYTINVPVGTTAIYLTSSFTNATAKVNGTIAANGVRKKVSLTSAETEIELILTPTSGNNLSANTYKITVVCGSFTKTTVSDDGKSFTITPINIETGKTVILALYNGEKFVEMQSAVYTGEAVPFTTTKTYTKAKVMVWDDFKTLKPVCDVEELN